MRDQDRFKLIFGPYRPPKTRPGKHLFCEARGTVKVCGYSDGPIPWPCLRTKGSKGRGCIIVCGSLVKALQRESAVAVAHWWGVSIWTVCRWRKAVGVERYNQGTLRLHRDWWTETATPAVRRLALQRGHDPALLAMLARERRKSGKPPTFGRTWTAAEEARLGKASDALLAKELGCSATAVARRRKLLGIAAFGDSGWAVKRRQFVPLSGKKLLARRLTLGLSQREVAERAGIAVPHYHHLERGVVRRSTTATVERLAKALRCGAGELS